MAYEKYLEELGERIEDYERVRHFIKSEGWKLVQEILETMERNSNNDFMAERIEPEQHRANLLAVQMIRGPIEQMAESGPEWVEEFERLRRNQQPRRNPLAQTGAGASMFEGEQHG